MKALKVVVWDRANNCALGTFSNPPLGCKIEIDLENRTLDLGVKTLNQTQADICPGDVIELRVSEGLEMH